VLWGSPPQQSCRATPLALLFPRAEEERIARRPGRLLSSEGDKLLTGQQRAVPTRGNLRPRGCAWYQAGAAAGWTACRVVPWR
jgi:hypothetical protein